MRAIDADYLIKRLDKCDPMNGIGLEPVMAILDIKALISVMPTINAVPVKHGRWERQELAPPSYLFCSECGFPKKRGTWKFCPNCGAKMDLEG